MHPSQALLGFARVFQVSEHLILHKYKMPWEPDAGSEEYANTRYQELSSLTRESGLGNNSNNDMVGEREEFVKPAECNYSLYGAP
jgi:hypothetical protein